MNKIKMMDIFDPLWDKLCLQDNYGDWFEIISEVASKTSCTDKEEKKFNKHLDYTHQEKNEFIPEESREFIPEVELS